MGVTTSIKPRDVKARRTAERTAWLRWSRVRMPSSANAIAPGKACVW